MGDNERLCALELRLQLKSSMPQAGLEPRTIDQNANASNKLAYL